MATEAKTMAAISPGVSWPRINEWKANEKEETWEGMEWRKKGRKKMERRKEMKDEERRKKGDGRRRKWTHRKCEERKELEGHLFSHLVVHRILHLQNRNFLPGIELDLEVATRHSLQLLIDVFCVSVCLQSSFHWIQIAHNIVEW